MKFKIKKADFDKLNEELQKAYKKLDDDTYQLKLEADDDDDLRPELRRANERLKQERETLRQEKEAAEAKLAELEEQGNKKKGNIDALEASYKEKIKKIEETKDATIAGLKKQLSTLLVDNVAQAIASEISKKPKVLLPHIKARLEANLEGDTPSTRVLGSDGKPSAATLDELKKQFVDNEDFADIIIGSKASGSGGPGQGGGSRGAKKPSEYSEAERIALFREDRAEFNRLFPPSGAN